LNQALHHSSERPYNWVKPELDKGLARVRNALEQYGANLAEFAPLISALAPLHEVRGTLLMLEYYGAALLAEEMERTLKEVLAERIPQREEAFEALVQASLGLEGYLDRLAQDGRDVPLALLALLNDLRAAQQRPLLTENALFAPDLSILPSVPERLATDPEAAGNLVENAQTARPFYQAALLSWYREPGNMQSIQQMKLIVRNMETSSHAPRVRQLFWIIGGLLEALSDKGLTANASLRLLLGQVDRHIRKIALGESHTIEAAPPIELLKNALFYVAHASGHGTRVDTLKNVYQLDKLTPSERDLQQIQGKLSGPRSQTLAAVATELDNLTQDIKTAMEACVTEPENSAQRLTPALEPLRQLADTLGLLGHGRARHALQMSLAVAQEIVAGRRSADEECMMQLAASIVHIETLIHHIGEEDALESAASDQARTATNESTDVDMSTTSYTRLPESEFRQLVRVTAAQAKINMAEIKNNILAYLTSPSKRRVLERTPILLGEIRGCLTMLSYAHAADLVGAVETFVASELLSSETVPARPKLDALAESIVSMEYFLEALSEDRGPIEPILDMARRCVRELGYDITPTKPGKDNEVPVLEAVVTRFQPRGTQPATPTITRVPLKSPFEELGPLTRAKITPFVAPEKPKKENLTLVKVEDAAQEDREVANIFVEEAYEELSQIGRSLKGLRLGDIDPHALAQVRRSYHTLKGSGRIAGAIGISEFAFAIEDLVNNVTVGVTDFDRRALEILAQAYNVLIDLIAAFHEGRPTPPSALALADRARKLRPDDFTHIEPTPPTPIMPAQAEKPALLSLAPIVAPPVAAPTPEPRPIKVEVSAVAAEPLTVTPIDEAALQESEWQDALDRFIKNALDEIGVIETFLNDAANSAMPTPIPERIVISVGELHRKALASEVEEFSQTTEMLRRYVDNIFRRKQPVQGETLDILTEFCQTTKEMLHAFVNPTAEPTHETEAPNSLDATQELETESTEIAGAYPEGERELIGVFLEEAADLLDHGYDTLRDWKGAGADIATLEALQRILHTLKGSARMAGIAPIGNLAHAVESLLEAILSGVVQANTQTRPATQSAFDSIADMVDSVRNGTQAKSDEILMQRLSSLATSHTDFPISAVVAKPAAPVESPAAAAIISPTVPTVPAAAAPETAAASPIVIAPAISPTPAPTLAALKEPILATEQENPPGAELGTDNKKADTLRMNASTVDALVDAATEESALLGRVDDYVAVLKTNLQEMDKTITRLNEHMRELEMELVNRSTPAASLHHRRTEDLSLDSFGQAREMLKRLMESVGDIESLHGAASRVVMETDGLVNENRKIHAQLHESLLSTRLVPLSKHAQRLQRVVRQSARELGKEAELMIEGEEGALDKTLLERLLGPIEHLLRNAVAHGIEKPDFRLRNKKSATGTVTLRFVKDRAENILAISDDGAGINVDAIRHKAVKTGLIRPDVRLTEAETLALILQPGFSTADSVSQISGRGIGMDVVSTEIQSMGGTLGIATEKGKGSRFTIRLPFTLAVSKTLLVRVGENLYALPSTCVEHTQPISKIQLVDLYREPAPRFNWRNSAYPFWYLGALLGDAKDVTLPTDQRNASVILLRHEEFLAALHVDEIVGTRDSVLKPTGSQLSHVKGLAGATILADGTVALILDTPTIAALANTHSQHAPRLVTEGERSNQKLTVLVVDDSVTVRKVTERFLVRQGFNVITAKDGVEALEQLEQTIPNVMLVDIEMPRMDGLELTERVRADARIKNIPIIMITSRTGKKHREHAAKVGVDIFLGKPYQESELLQFIEKLSDQNIGADSA